MRRWRSTLSSLSIIFMLFGVGTAMAPTIESGAPPTGAIEMRVGGPQSDGPSAGLCARTCPSLVPDPLPQEPVVSVTAPPVPSLAPRKAAVAAPPPAPRPVEEWRTLVSAYFAPSDVDLALLVISCESGGDPNAVNPSSGAAGLFQHIPRYWPERAAAVGLPGAPIFDPVANVAAAAWLVYTVGWSPWYASAGCW